MVEPTQIKMVIDLQACDFIEHGYRPRVTMIIAQKNHHAKLFPADGEDKQNVPPG